MNKKRNSDRSTLLLKFREVDGVDGISRQTLEELAMKLGQKRTQVVHRALLHLAISEGVLDRGGQTELPSQSKNQALKRKVRKLKGDVLEKSSLLGVNWDNLNQDP